MIEKIASQEGIDFVLVDNEEKALSYYLKEKADWVVFSNTFPYLDELHMESKTAQMSHGIGPKSSFYTQSSSKVSVRFVEGKDISTTQIKQLLSRIKEDDLAKVERSLHDVIEIVKSISRS